MAKVNLYDPYSGFGGTLMPLPRLMKEAVDKLNGKTISLEDAIKQFSKIAEEIGGKVEDVPRLKFISYKIKSGLLTHGYCLLKYK